MRLDYLGFGTHGDKIISMAKYDKGKYEKYKYASYIITNGSKKIDSERMPVPKDLKSVTDKFNETRFYDGWNSSFHDAQWNGLSAIVGFGPTEDIAIRRMQALVRLIVPGDDPSIRRFKLRNLVREGD